MMLKVVAKKRSSATRGLRYCDSTESEICCDSQVVTHVLLTITVSALLFRCWQQFPLHNIKYLASFNMSMQLEQANPSRCQCTLHRCQNIPFYPTRSISNCGRGRGGGGDREKRGRRCTGGGKRGSRKQDSQGGRKPSSETQGQLVGATGFSWAKVHNKNASGTRSVRVNAQGLSRSCGKLSPVKIPLPQLAAPGSPRTAGSRRKRETLHNIVQRGGSQQNNTGRELGLKGKREQEV